MQGGERIQIILLHVVEEIHVRIPNVYIDLRIIAGKPTSEAADMMLQHNVRHLLVVDNSRHNM